MSGFDILQDKALHEIRRGLLKLFILRIVRDERIHGYGIMKRLKEMTGGWWRPSPGSMYPALRSLEKSALIRSIKEGNRRVYTITPKGKAFLRQVRENVERVTDDIRALFGKAGHMRYRRGD